MGAGTPDAVRTCIDCCENIEQVLYVYVLRGDPLCFYKIGLVRVKGGRQLGEVTFPRCAEERGRHRILGTKVVSEWYKHRDEFIAPVRQRKDAELVEDIGSVGDRGKQPANVVFIDALWEEGDDSQKCSSVRAKLLK